MVRKKDLRGGGQEREEAGSERETWGERDKGGRDNQAHTYMNTHTHRVREHNSEVTTVFFFFCRCISRWYVRTSAGVYVGL